MNAGRALRQARRRAGFSQRGLAAVAGIELEVLTAVREETDRRR